MEVLHHPLGEVHEVHVGRAVFVLVEAEDVDVVDVVRGDGVLDLIVLEVLKAGWPDAPSSACTTRA